MARAYIDLGKPFTLASHYEIFKLTNKSRREALVKLGKAQNFICKDRN